ncbi:hypothetical protein LguiB_032891 [Lonicera macranthoides]
MDEQVVGEGESPEQRPGIFVIGSSNVGKRTLLSRTVDNLGSREKSGGCICDLNLCILEYITSIIPGAGIELKDFSCNSFQNGVGKRRPGLLSVDFEDAPDSSSDLRAYGWTINTKYYTADVSVWMAHLHEEFYIEALPIFDQLAALVMVFDINDVSQLLASLSRTIVVESAPRRTPRLKVHPGAGKGNHFSKAHPIQLSACLMRLGSRHGLKSFVALKDWVSRTDIQKFDVLICIGNKVDLLPGHSAHVEYRRRLQKLDESWGNNNNNNHYPDFSWYGISETEGSSLLGDEESPWEIKNSYLEWCIEHNIEYVEACASNAEFDKSFLFADSISAVFVFIVFCSPTSTCIGICYIGLSVDGDSQGVERLYGALSAHMWHGMTLKSGNKINEPSLPEKQELSEEESDYEIEYEVLSAGSAEPWDDTWVTANGVISSSDKVESVGQNSDRPVGGDLHPSTSSSQLHEEIQNDTIPKDLDEGSEPDEGTHYELEDLEKLMSEIGSMRDSLRLMPDFQRREMAGKLAMKMAAMFGDSSGDEQGF